MPTINLQVKRHNSPFKVCMKCYSKLPIECFCKRKESVDGYYNECKECTNERKKRLKDKKQDKT